MRVMGILNITPDSFSDGGRHNRVESCRRQFRRLASEAVDIIDVGAESTAPSNRPVGAQAEWERFESILLPALKGMDLAAAPMLSVDTFRPATFRRLAKVLPVSLMWNDVSGVIDEETLEVLREFPDTTYVFCHNPVPVKCDATSHMKHCRADLSRRELYRWITGHFRLGLERIKEVLPASGIVLDPAFGFGKSSRQNRWLLTDWMALAREFSAQDFLLGISRKRFLREWGADGDWPGSEALQASIVAAWCSRWRGPAPIIRLHDPGILSQGTIAVEC